MSWLRIDDAFTTHPKVLALNTPMRRWTWLEVLTYTCRYRSPVVPENIADVVPRATKTFVESCISIGLIDVQHDGAMHVHDWQEYQAGDPKKALRQAKWRKSVDGHVDADVDGSVDGEVDASRTGARAQTRPVPSPTPRNSTSSVTSKELRTPLDPNYEATAKEIERERDTNRDVERDDDGQPLKIREVQRLGEVA